METKTKQVTSTMSVTYFEHSGRYWFCAHGDKKGYENNIKEALEDAYRKLEADPSGFESYFIGCSPDETFTKGQMPVVAFGGIRIMGAV